MATDYTNSPSIGDTVSDNGSVKRWNGVYWESVAPVGPGIAQQVFTASGTYTPSPGMRWCVVEAVGGGGGGGGVSNGGASLHTRAGGGGGGAYVRSILTIADIGASQTVTIGAGGTGGAAGANNGSDGGDTSLGSLVVADAGNGGVHGDSSDGGWGGAGGNATDSTGDFIVPGSRGHWGQWSDGTSPGDYNYGVNGGGYSFFGAGQASIGIWHEGDGDDATAATCGYGVGGGGGSEIGTTDRAGGDGSAGVIIITEFFEQNYYSQTVYDTNGNELLVPTATASAVNHIGIANAATSGSPTISAIGDDTNIALTLEAKGNQSIVTNNSIFMQNDGSPTLYLYDTTNPSPAGLLGQIQVDGQDSAGNYTVYGTLDVEVVDNTNGSEDALFLLYLQQGGSNTEQIRIQNGGISFDSGSNYLDAYEEGTFTPSFTTSGTDFTTLAYDAQEGAYTKVGKVCTVTITLDVNSGGSTLGSPTGTLRVAGLPFTAQNSTDAYSCGVGDCYSFTGAREPNAIQTIPNVSYAVLLLLPSGANADGCDAADLSTSSQLYMSLTYLTE